MGDQMGDLHVVQHDGKSGAHVNNKQIRRGHIPKTINIIVAVEMGSAFVAILASIGIQERSPMLKDQL